MSQDDDDDERPAYEWTAPYLRFRCPSNWCMRYWPKKRGQPRMRWKYLRAETNRDCHRCGRLMRELLPSELPGYRAPEVPDTVPESVGKMPRGWRRCKLCGGIHRRGRLLVNQCPKAPAGSKARC